MSVSQYESEDRFLTIKDVCDKLSLSKTKIYNMIRQNEFPPGTQLGARCTRWPLSEVQKWMQQRLNAKAA
jgi:prophage regulatory protein